MKAEGSIQRITMQPLKQTPVVFNSIEITLRHGCSPVNLLHIFKHLFLRTPLDSCFWIKMLKNLRTCFLHVIIKLWTNYFKTCHVEEGMGKLYDSTVIIETCLIISYTYEPSLPQFSPFISNFARSSLLHFFQKRKQQKTIQNKTKNPLYQDFEHLPCLKQLHTN